MLSGKGPCDLAASDGSASGRQGNGGNPTWAHYTQAVSSQEDGLYREMIIERAQAEIKALEENYPQYAQEIRGMADRR